GSRRREGSRPRSASTPGWDAASGRASAAWSRSSAPTIRAGSTSAPAPRGRCSTRRAWSGRARAPRTRARRSRPSASRAPTRLPREALGRARGDPTPRIAETPSGLLNAIGLQGIGIHAFVRDVVPRMRRHDVALVVNVCGDTVEEYAEVARVCDGTTGIAGLEINISCPNVKQGGMAFGGDPKMTHAVVAAVRGATRLPVIPKLSPHVPDIPGFARAAED